MELLKSATESPVTAPVMSAIREALSVMREEPESFTGRSLSHRCQSDNRSVSHHLLHFCEHGRGGVRHAVLPFADIFGDDLNPPTKGKLAQPHDPSSHHDLVSRGLNGPWIRAKEPDEARPKGGCRSHLVTFPAFIMFTQSVQSFSGLRLGQFQDQPARSEVLPQGYRPDFEPLLNELSQPDRRSGGLESEVAKWQNRMTPILSFCDFLIAGKLDKVEFDLAVSDDDGSDHQFGHAALFLQGHFRPAGMEVDCLRDHLFTSKVVYFENIALRPPPSRAEQSRHLLQTE